MTTFVDTSALYAVLDRDDERHEAARKTWTRILSEDAPLLTSNYVLVESFALIQSRLGMEALRTFSDAVLPVIRLHWVSEEDHRTGAQAVLAADRRDLSLVDCVSFELMPELGIDRAFAFDAHFAQQGFRSIPWCLRGDRGQARLRGANDMVSAN